MTMLWALTTAVLLIFILVLSKQLNDASARLEYGSSVELKSILFGTSLVDVGSLCLTGVYLASTWYVEPDDATSSETVKYCVQLLWSEVLLDASVILLIIAAIVWIRQSLLLKDVPSAFDRLMPLKTSPSGRVSWCLRTIIEGPSNWFIVAVLVSLLLATSVNKSLKGGSQDADLRLCTAEPFVNNRLLMTLVVLMFILWWTVTVLATKVLRRGRQDASCRLFSVSLLTDNPESLSPSAGSPDDANGIRKFSRLPLFLATTSVWLAPIQCLVTMTVLEFSRMTTARVVFLIWIYTCTTTFLSLVLSVCVCVCLPRHISISDKS